MGSGEIDMRRVYYYTTAQFGLSDLALRRLKVSRFSELNDPFELLSVDMRDPDYRPAFIAHKTEMNKNWGLICFSKDWNNLLLWSHYSECCRGVCLGFDVPADKVSEVKYQEKLTKINIEKSPQGAIDDLLLNLTYIKSDKWIHENEIRMLVKFDECKAQSKYYFLPFSEKFVLRDVFLGMHCDLPIEDIRELLNTSKQTIQKINIIKTKMTVTKFGVTEDKDLRPNQKQSTNSA
jgi:Protein of unknown function (DUF2971)